MAIRSTRGPSAGRTGKSPTVRAGAEAPMLMTVMAESSVTSRSLGARDGRSAPCGLGAMRRRRARRAINTAASAPDSRPEPTDQRHEGKQLEDQAVTHGSARIPGHGDRAAAAVSQPCRIGDDSADGVERVPCVDQTLAQALEGFGLADGRETRNPRAAGRPVDRIRRRAPRPRPRGGGDRQRRLHVHAGTDTALVEEPAEIGRETVGENPSSRHAAGAGEPAPSATRGRGPQVSAGETSSSRAASTPRGAVSRSSTARPRRRPARVPVTATRSPAGAWSTGRGERPRRAA